MITDDVYVRNTSKNFLNDAFQQYCGVRLISQVDGTCKTSLVITQKQANASKRLHAGVTYAVLDVTAFLAAITLVPERQYPVTHNMSVSILSSVEIGAEIFFEAKVIRRGKTQCFIEAKAYALLGMKKKIIATAMLTKAILNNVVVY